MLWLYSSRTAPPHRRRHCQSFDLAALRTVHTATCQQTKAVALSGQRERQECRRHDKKPPILDTERRLGATRKPDWSQVEMERRSVCLAASRRGVVCEYVQMCAFDALIPLWDLSTLPFLSNLTLYNHPLSLHRPPTLTPNSSPFYLCWRVETRKLFRTTKRR